MYIDTERKLNEQRIIYHAPHAAKITRHGLLEENIGIQWTRKHEYMFCLGYDEIWQSKHCELWHFTTEA